MTYRLIISCCLLGCFVPSSRAQSVEWPLVVVKGHLTFPLPPSMELVKGTFSPTMKDGREVLVVTEDDPSVWAQTKGVNAAEGDPNEARTAAILVKVDLGKPGDYQPLGADMSMSAEELKQLDDQLHTEFARSGEESGEMSDLSWGGTQVVQLEGTQAIRLRYTARMLQADARFVVNSYMVQNFDTMYYITATYKLEEQEKWTDDLTAALSQIRFEKRGE